MAIYRTATFRLHQPTRHVRAVLDRALEHYTQAYGVALYRFHRYSADELLAMATVELGGTCAHDGARRGGRGSSSGSDSRGGSGGGRTVWSVSRLEQRLFVGQRATAIRAALAPLEYSVRESLRRHVARTLLSYVAQSVGTQLAKETGVAVASPRRGAVHRDVEGTSGLFSASMTAASAGARPLKPRRTRRWWQARVGAPQRPRRIDVGRLRLEGLRQLAAITDAHTLDELRQATALSQWTTRRDTTTRTGARHRRGLGPPSRRRYEQGNRDRDRGRDSGEGSGGARDGTNSGGGGPGSGTREARGEPIEAMAIPFCRIAADRTCGLFYQPDTGRFYARLFV